MKTIFFSCLLLLLFLEPHFSLKSGNDSDVGIPAIGYTGWMQSDSGNKLFLQLDPFSTVWGGTFEYNPNFLPSTCKLSNYLENVDGGYIQDMSVNGTAVRWQLSMYLCNMSISWTGNYFFYSQSKAAKLVSYYVQQSSVTKESDIWRARVVGQEIFLPL